MKKSSLALNSSSSSRRSSSSNSKRHILDRSTSKASRREVKVLDNDGKNVTPQPLYHAEPRDMPSKPGRLFLHEISPGSGSDHWNTNSSSSTPFCSSFMGSTLLSRLSTTTSLTKETEDSVPKPDIPINPPVPMNRDSVQQHVTEEMLDEEMEICLTETDTISLLDIPNTSVSEDADDAEDIQETNTRYAALCKNKMGNDKYVAHSMQTFTGAPKSKETQTDTLSMKNEGTIVTIWDIYDSFCGQNETQNESEMADSPESTVNTSKCQEKRGERSSGAVSSTMSLLLEKEMSGSSIDAESDPQLIMMSESFQHSLLVMERSIVANIFQPKLAAYRQLPILKDSDSAVKPRTKDQSRKVEESSLSPTLERLWAFSCELTRGCNITSMAWNKKNQDLLAVGYGSYDPKNQTPGLVCSWSLKNPTWPERVFHCHSCVTALDFSDNSPGQLAVGMYDGTVAIYDIQSRTTPCIANSSECYKKHLHPVWQVKWITPCQETLLSGEEALVSLSADGRIAKWILSGNGLDCIDLLKLKKTHNCKQKAEENKTELSLSTTTSGLCLDFHPTASSIYLVGTLDGLICKCSISNSQHFLDTYRKHALPVNHVEWSPFSSDVFLSCSSDWAIKLWKQDLLTPMLSLTSAQKAVSAVRWSPNWSTIFAAISGQQVEIWDLTSSIRSPIIVHDAAAGVNMTSLLFTKGTDCVLVGDSDGQVTVYQLKNLSVGGGKQVDSLEDIIHSAVSRSQYYCTVL
ncbi:dynein axonemal intermediate chain 4-like [Epinephelus moara]|uniref:dynein axonemal intermediate chain 4-like n=1 Tax=Epinephelus moara TaxID=300413 RepID=UPI00214E93F0|nr:dynein axonemal intermediate chain 4-like [Epinephelus moara]